jgi:hypothetical protein
MAAAWTQKGTRSMQAVQQLTEAAPTDTKEGVDLEDVASIAPIVHAPAGQTFTGEGSGTSTALRCGSASPGPTTS